MDKTNVSKDLKENRRILEQDFEDYEILIKDGGSYSDKGDKARQDSFDYCIY